MKAIPPDRALLWAAALLCLLMVGTVLWGIIGVGLDVRTNIFVQEYWQDGRPNYLVANLRDKPVVIRVAPWKPSEGPGAMLTQWHVGEGTYCLTDAPGFPSKDFLAFDIVDGPHLGLLEAPASLTKDKDVVTVAGLNGSGGRNSDVVFHHKSIEIRRGDAIEITLRIKSGCGTVYLDKTQLLTGEGKPAKSIGLPSAQFVKGESLTLPIRITESQVILDASQADTTVKDHEVKLTYRLPDDFAGPLVVIGGWVSESPGRAHGIVRGIGVRQD